MNVRPVTRDPLPPRLSMDEYVEFVEAAWRECDPRLAAKQKALEKRIRKRFCITGDLSGSKRAR